MKRRRKDKPVDGRTATLILGVIGVSTAVFVVMNYISFLITGVEQVVMIEWYFRGIVIELGVMMAKRITEVIVGREKKSKSDSSGEVPEEFINHEGGFDNYE